MNISSFHVCVIISHIIFFYFRRSAFKDKETVIEILELMKVVFFKADYAKNYNESSRGDDSNSDLKRLLKYLVRHDERLFISKPLVT